MCCCTTHALYRSKLWQQDHCQHPQNTNPDDSTYPGWWKQSFQLWLWSLVWFQVRFQVRAISYHLTSLKSGAIRWPVADPGCGSRTRCQPTSPKRPRLGFRRSAMTLYPSLTGAPPPPTWTRWTTSFGHMSRTSPTWPPSLIATIHRATAGACRKGLLPVLDPYWGSDWGWRRLHWIDVSSTTKSSYLNWFFQ